MSRSFINVSRANESSILNEPSPCKIAPTPTSKKGHRGSHKRPSSRQTRQILGHLKESACARKIQRAFRSHKDARNKMHATMKQQMARKEADERRLKLLQRKKELDIKRGLEQCKR